MTLQGLRSTTYQVTGVPIGSGGEGDIYRVTDADGGGGRVAKLYRSEAVSRELEEKLKLMVQNPPNASVLSQVAWPLDVVYEGGRFRGFIMQELKINAELGDVYKYPSVLPLSTKQKMTIAQNICAVIAEVHKAGYVFGDFNPRNIGLDTSTGLVSFLDTDTYHVASPESGKTYRCNVCAPGYAAPEILERCSDFSAKNPTASKHAYAQTPLPTFTQETDNFALAIHVFKLIMNGFTPFGGIIETSSASQSSPGVGDAAVRRDSYCFKPGIKHQSSAILPPEALPQEIMDLFNRAFIDGKQNPQNRPTSRQWFDALERLEKSLVNCPNNPLHQYDRKNSECPLCAADRRYGAVTGQAPAAPPQPVSPHIAGSSIQGSSIQAPPVPAAPVQVPGSSPPTSSPGMPHPHSGIPAAPARVSPIDIIRGSRKRIRKLSTIFSLLLWACTIAAYIVVSYNLGYRNFSLDFTDTSGAWVFFVFAALIGACVELLFSYRELKVLTGTIDLRELKSGSGVEVELREYKRKLTIKIKILSVITVIVLIATIFIAATDMVAL